MVFSNVWGISINSGSHNEIFNNTLYANRDTGIHVDWFSTGTFIHDNIVAWNEDFGVCVINGVNETTIHQNTLFGSFWGIHLETSLHNSIIGNSITRNTGGISIYASFNNTLSENEITDNEIGILLQSNSSYNTISRNSIATTYNNSIVLMDVSFSNTISENLITDSYNGIQLHTFSNLNTIIRNTLIHNECGVEIQASSSNRFFHNNFIENTQQVLTLTWDANFWDDGYPNGGNYWSDYSDLDLYSGQYQNETGSDGIGDTPYMININNTDGYPLMRSHYYSSGMTHVVSTESPDHSEHPSLAVDFSGNIHVAWRDETNYANSGNDSDIFYKKFIVGLGWTTTQVVSTESTGESFNPSLAVDLSGNIHIAWEDETNYAGCGPDTDIFYKKYEIESGWTITQIVSTESTSNSYSPSLTVDLRGNVHVAWTDWTDYLECGLDSDIFYKMYGVYVGWTTTEVVSNDESEIQGNSWNPSLDVDSGGTLHTAWADYTNYTGCGVDADIFYKRNENGSSWTTAQVVSTESTTNSYVPSLAADSSGDIHVAWADYTNYTGCGVDADIFYKRNENGSSWTTAQVVSTESTSFSYWPSLIADSSSYIHVAWYDRTNYTGCGVDADIFYKRNENGSSWTTAQVVSTESTADSLDPSLDADSSGNVHVAWGDATNYANCGLDSDIFYKYIRVHSTRYPWPMFRHNPQHTGYAETPGPNTNQTLWSYTTGVGVVSSPAVADGRVFIGSYDGKLYALDQYTGALEWNYSAGAWISCSPAVSDGRVYFGSHSGGFLCLDSFSGEVLWYYTMGAVLSSPTVISSKVYIGSYNRNIYCLDAVNGSLVWNFTTGDSVGSSPAVVDDMVFVGSNDHNVYCLDAETGEPIWNQTTAGIIYSSPAVVDGVVFVGSYDGFIYAFNQYTGVVEWSYFANASISSSPAFAYDRVYVGSDAGRVYCLNASTGSYLWDYQTGDVVGSSPAVASGKVYFGSRDNDVYCVDALSGDLIWRYSTAGSVRSSPAVADGMVFVGSADRNVYALGDVIRVPEDYPTVQQAIDAATPETTISVAPGVYSESLIVNKTLTIIGRVGSAPIFDGGGSGIAVTLLSGASGSIVSGIVITNYDQGIVIIGSSDCEIYGNIMSQMEYSGVAVEGSSAVNNLIYGNIIKDNAMAIDLIETSSGSTIYKNIIKTNAVAIDLESNGNIIYSNNFVENDVGLNITNTQNNIIYHNNFINNIDDVAGEALVNIWDDGYPSGGNYWSTHVGSDIYSGVNQDQPGSDGIIDSNYTVAVNNVDHYPLAQPFNPHDIGITDVSLLKNVVGQGFKANITISILNSGIHDETFTVTVYADMINVFMPVVSIVKRTSTTITVQWDTSGIPKGNYTIRVEAPIIPDEIFIDDNLFVDGWIIISMVGDITGPSGWADGKCDMRDVGLVARFFGQDAPPAPANCDLTGPTTGTPDGKIDMRDVGLVARHFGETDP
jgi:parallel beta-helix repeat protein